METRIFDIIIPTYNNLGYLIPCVDSIVKTGVLSGAAKLYIVNNGSDPLEKYFKNENIIILKPEDNLGWEGGLKYALERSTAPFVVFQNDDTIIPPSSVRFYWNLLYPFQDNSVAAVGPTTTVASGIQSIFNQSCPRVLVDAPYLIFFTVMVRREHLDAVGGVDDTLPGGDDFDLSIRFKKAGKRIVICPNAFIIHHGFKTGERVHGRNDQPDGWNSIDKIERTNHALIKKHGFKTFFKTMCGSINCAPGDNRDLEGDFVRQFIEGDHVVDLGCGPNKTIPNAVGVDRVRNGMSNAYVPGASVADVAADVQEPLPFLEKSQDTLIARHILEHCVDSLKTLRQWNKVLKMGGRLIVAVPDENVITGIPLNPEHVHAFTGESLKHLMEASGFKEIKTEYTGNGVSLVGVFEKTEHMNGSHK